MTGRVWIFGIAAALTLAIPTVLPIHAARADKEIVLIAGKPSHPHGEHEFHAGALLFQKALAGVPGVHVTVVANGWPTKLVDGKTVDDDGVLERADAVLIYADGGAGHPAIQGDRMKVIDALAARGAGLGFAHYAVEVPAGAAGVAMYRWVGGYYEDHYSVNPIWSPQFGRLPSHPVTRGVKPFSTRDEWYFNMRWTPDRPLFARVTPILVDTPSDAVRHGPYVSPRGPYDHIIAASGRAETMMWVFDRPDGGRSFAFTGGHTHAHWGDPNQRKIVLNALLWIAKVDVPPNGVEDRITAADLTTNLDPK
jgi:type 1 glutamine amidotransferase